MYVNLNFKINNESQNKIASFLDSSLSLGDICKNKSRKKIKKKLSSKGCSLSLAYTFFFWQHELKYYTDCGIFRICTWRSNVSIYRYLQTECRPQILSRTHLGNADLLNNILLSIGLLFHQKGFSKRAFANLLYSHVSIHFSGKAS